MKRAVQLVDSYRQRLFVQRNALHTSSSSKQIHGGIEGEYVKGIPAASSTFMGRIWA